MTATQIRDLVGLDKVRPTIQQVDEMMACPAYVRQTQMIFERLDSLYAVLIQTSLPEADMHRIRGHIIALEEVLGIHTKIAADIKFEAANRKPDAEERPDGEHAFRAALKEQKEKNNV